MTWDAWHDTWALYLNSARDEFIAANCAMA